MAFYSDLSDVYDALFPVSAAQKALFEEFLRSAQVRRVADAGCGTGAQLLPFAMAGRSCIGFDPDPSLVALARARLGAFPDARVHQGGFADTSTLVRPPADLVLCLGNSLVHVPQDQAARFVRDAAQVTTAAGAVLVQVLNYDRLFRKGITELPLLAARDGAVEFRRTYAWEGKGTVRFRTELTVPGERGSRVLRSDIPLYPVYPDELRGMLRAAGFTRIESFGDFAGSRFSPESEALVCIARKP